MSKPSPDDVPPDAMSLAQRRAAPSPDLKPVLDALPDAVLLVDRRGIVTFANQSAGTLFGYPPQDLTGSGLGTLIPALGNGQVATVAARLEGRRSDATPVALDVSCSHFSSRAGSGFVLTIRAAPDDDTQRDGDSELLTRAFEQSPVAMLIVDAQGRALHGNPAFCELTGSPLDRLRGRCLDDATLCCGDGQGFAEKLRERRESGSAGQAHVLRQVVDGAPVSLLETLSPLRDGAGQITHFLVTRQEITEQEMTKTALQRSEQRFREVTELAGEWLWEQNGDGRYTYSSAALFDILGYRPDEIIGKSYLDLLTPGDRQHWTTKLPASPNIPEPFHRLINRYRHKDGHEVFTESSGEPVLGEGGAIIAWRGVDHDITTRKRFEDALHVRERAIDAASVGITIIDARAEGRPIVYVNAALCQMIGLARDELLYRSHACLHGPDGDPLTWGIIDEALAEGSAVSLTARLRRHGGEVFWSDLQVSPVRDADGQISHFIWVIADVTERQHAAEARHELEMARHIQSSLLPKARLQSDRLEATGICIPAGAIGGDFYDYFTTTDGVALAIADVSGHSVGAALMMSETRSALRAEIRTARADGRDFGPAAMLALLNELLFEDLNGADLFITMFFIDFDPVTRRLRYANAGHCPGLVAKGGQGECLALDADGLILGVRPEVRFEERNLLLKPGDVVLLYTDGVIEASDPSGNFYGVERLSAQLLRHRDRPAEDVMQAVLSDVRTFCGHDRRADDTSLLILKVR